MAWMSVVRKETTYDIEGECCFEVWDSDKFHVMQKYLFKFGFEAPDEHLTNQRSGTDFESSWAIWISAHRPQDAMSWGIVVADEFVRQLYEKNGITGSVWSKSNFAHWICDDPAQLEEAKREDSIPDAKIGVMPDFSWALSFWGR